MKKIAIFASGSGTNAENIIRYFSRSETVKVAVVLSNNPNAGVHARVNALGVPSFTFRREEFALGETVLNKLAAYEVELIVLAGFMNKITEPLLAAYPNRIVNIHPALLPSFKGLDTHQRAIDAGVRMAGTTVHFVTAALDGGAIIAQAAVPVLPSDDAHRLADRVLVYEHQIYARAVKACVTGKVRYENERAVMDDQTALELTLFGQI